MSSGGTPEGETATEARCWAITSGEIGMRHQAEGLARLLDTNPRSLTRGLARVLSFVPPHLLFSDRGWLFGSRIWAKALLRAQGLTPPWPAFLVTCGRRSVAIALAIRLISGGKTKTIHVQHPRVPFSCFDVVVLPAHDVGGKVLEEDNVITMKGAMHHLVREPEDGGASEGEAAALWAELPKPWFGVILGGKSRAYDITAADVAGIADGIRASVSKAGGGSVIIIPSRRTDASVGTDLRQQLEDVPVYLWDGSDPNPYREILFKADFLCVTRDSVSMLSEACYTGTPVYLLRVSGHSDRLAAFHASLLEDHHARWLDEFDPAWTPSRLDEVSRLAEEITRRFGGIGARERGEQEDGEGAAD